MRQGGDEAPVPPPRREQRGCPRAPPPAPPPLALVKGSSPPAGVTPARHNMFDFLNRSLKTYIPELSSSRVRGPKRMLKIGKYRIPLSRPTVEMRRKSRTFWNILGERHISSTILRVPITFPPEKFNGRLLSAMCTPDLLGTQGSFALFTTEAGNGSMEGGNRFPLTRDGIRWRGVLRGPQNYMVEGGGPLQIPFALTPDGPGAVLEIAGKRHPLAAAEY